jgi:hypothetical protein
MNKVDETPLRVPNEWLSCDLGSTLRHFGNEKARPFPDETLLIRFVVDKSYQVADFA